jgi:AraC-like DNA-binding protein
LVATPEKTWAVPPQQAVWIPPNVLHEVTARDALALRTLYFEPQIVRRLSKECSVVDVSPLLRELVLRALAPPSEQTNVARNRIERLIVDEMTIAKVSPFSLPFPEVRRLRAIVDQLLADPGDDRSFDELCQSSGGSSRTLSRLFIQHTGMTFGKWRERLRFIRALELLVDGQSVGTIAYLLGYQHPSAFINMFKRQIGVSPARYLRINSVCGGMTAKVGAGKHSPGASSVMAASTSVLNSSGHMKLV